MLSSMTSVRTISCTAPPAEPRLVPHAQPTRETARHILDRILSLLEAGLWSRSFVFRTGAGSDSGIVRGSPADPSQSLISLGGVKRADLGVDKMRGEKRQAGEETVVGNKGNASQFLAMGASQFDM